MAEIVRCPNCGLKQRLDDSPTSEQRCQDCQEVLVADTSERDGIKRLDPDRSPRRSTVDRPTRSRRDRDHDEDDYERPRRSQFSTVLPWVLGAVIGGPVLLFLLCCGGIFLLAPNAIVTTPGGGFPAPPAPVVVNPPPDEKKPPLIWNVQADPSDRPPVQVRNPERKVTPWATFPYIAIVASSPGPFIAVGSNLHPMETREVWNLERMESVGKLSKVRLRTHGLLTPDGAYLAGQLNGKNGEFVVYSCKDGTNAFELKDNNLLFYERYDFAGSRKLIFTKRENWKSTCYVYEVPSGRKLRQFEMELHQKDNPWATSPGGRYLALVIGNEVLIYDLEQGKLAGKYPVPNALPGMRHKQLAFSANGKELALLSASFQSAKIHTWDLVGNRLACNYTIVPSIVGRLKTGPNYWGRHLEWLEDGSGWLFRGEVLIDRFTGRPVWRMDLTGDTNYVRHVVGSTHVTRFLGNFAREGMELVAIRRGEGNLAQFDLHFKEPDGTAKALAVAMAALQKFQISWERNHNRPGIPVIGVGFIQVAATDEALASLSVFPELEKVALYKSNVSAKGIAGLKKLPKLKELHLGSDMVLTNEILESVNSLTRLETLSIWCKNTTNDSLAHLKDLTGLRKLSLSNTPIDDGALVHLKGMKELRVLDLFNVGSITEFRRITDVGLEHIKGLTKLEVLLVPNSSVSGKGMAHLKDMPELRELNLFHTNLDDTGLAHLQNHTKLEVLHIPGTRFSDDGLAALAGLQHLRDLDLSFSKLTDRGMVHLKNLSELRRLNLGSTSVGEAGMVHLQGLTKLTRLDLGNNTDAGLAHLINCKDLQHLSASGVGITDAGLRHFKGMKHLYNIWLYKTRATPAGVAELKKSIPQVTVYLK